MSDTIYEESDNTSDRQKGGQQPPPAYQTLSTGSGDDNVSHRTSLGSPFSVSHDEDVLKQQPTDDTNGRHKPIKISPSSGEHREVSWIRSEPMALCQLFIQSESAYNCVDLFGGIGMCEFRDLNQECNAFQRKFVHELRRCDEIERQLGLYLKTN